MVQDARMTPERIVHLPILYRLFFLWIEPLSTIVGAFYAHFLPQVYLELTHAASAPTALVPVGTRVALTQLANLYLAFAINEALVLRSSSDVRVWRALLLGLLIADFGHLYSVWALGLESYWRFWTWNAINWGNVGFVYCGAMTRVAFLCGIGVATGRRAPNYVREKTS